MSELKTRRQRVLAELIRSESLANQDEVAARLAGLGFEVTQATVSRDLEQLSAVKVRRGDRTSYALPDQLSAAASNPSRLAVVLRDWVRAIDVAATTTVVKTPPGSAHLIGVALDESGLAEIVGTLCGDDTIFIACRSAQDAHALADRLRGLAAGSGG